MAPAVANVFECGNGGTGGGIDGGAVVSVGCGRGCITTVIVRSSQPRNMKDDVPMDAWSLFFLFWHKQRGGYSISVYTISKL